MSRSRAIPALRYPFVATILVALNSTIAVATEEQTRLPEEPVRLSETLTVSANRDEALVDEVGSTVTIIDREEIERRNRLYVGDLLRTVPGFELTQTGGPGQVASARLRGGTAAQTLVLIDGVRINTTTNGDVDFSHLQTTGIERIEVLRGPQATYGSEAVAGVISIVTRRAVRGLEAGITGEVGERSHQRIAADLSGGRERFDYHLSASDLETDAVSQLAGGSETDPYENTTVVARLGFDLPNAGRLLASGRRWDGDTALDGFGVEDPNAMSNTTGEQIALLVQLPFTERWSQTFRVAETDSDLLGSDPDTFFNNYDIQSRSTQLEAQADVLLGERSTLNFGLATEERDGFNLGGFEEQADLDSAFAQFQISTNDYIHLTGAVRHDDHSVFGDETTYRATATAASRSGSSRIRASFGTGFRAPNFSELFFPFGGNMALRPETSDGWDIGWSQQWSSGRFALDLTWFSIDFEDLIQFDLGTFAFENVTDASSRGAELSLHYRHGASFQATLTHTYNDTEDARTGSQLARRPERRSSLLAQFQASSTIDGAVSVISVRDRIDSTGLAMDDYERVDVSVRWRALDWLVPFARLENAFDEDYEEVTGFTTPGATFYAGVRLQTR